MATSGSKLPARWSLGVGRGRGYHPGAEPLQDEAHGYAHVIAMHDPARGFASRHYGAISKVGMTQVPSASASARSSMSASMNSNRRKTASFAHLSSTHDTPKLSSSQTMAHLISFMAGSGLVFLPLALKEIDWYGLAMLVLAGCCMVFTSRLQVEVMDVVRWSSGKAHVSFADLARECWGRVGAMITRCILFGGLLLETTGYFALASFCLAEIAGLHYGTVVVLVGVVVWTSVFFRSLPALALCSAVNVALCYWIETVIIGDAMYPLKQVALDKSMLVFGTPDLSQAALPSKLAYSFLLLASGFYGHAIIPTLYNSMDDHRKCATVVRRSQLGLLFTLYLPICGITYAVYGATLQAPVFFNMRNAVVRNLAISLYCLHVLFSSTITLQPLQHAIESAVLSSTSTTRPPLLSSPFVRQMSRPGSIDGLTMPDDNEERERERLDNLIRLCCRSAPVLLALILAYIFQPTTLATFTMMLIPITLLALVFPCLFYWKLCGADAHRLDKIGVVSILLLAVASVWWGFRVVM